MSYIPEESSTLNTATGSQRRPRACDACRRKKVRCDGPVNPDMQCSNCIASRFSCTYVEESTRRVPSKIYIASLEDRIGELDTILRKLCPDRKIYNKWITSLSEERPTEHLASPSHLTASAPTPPLAEFPPPSIFGPKPIESITKAIRATHEDSPSRVEDEEDLTPIPGSSLDTNRFFGKSSGEMLVRTALSMKKEYIGDVERPILSHRREEFWSIRPWERISPASTPRRYVFPEPDLAKELVDLFFEHVNLFLPLLHRPSFERSIRDGLHFAHDGFASIYILVCAVGSKFSTDPRVLLDGVDSYHSAGWKWYDQVETGKTSLLSLPSLYDLQLYCLTVLFLQCSSAPQSVWTMVGIAIRLAQDVGAHRRRSTTPTVESELWKRAWWVLICIDRLVCLSLGRPLTIQDEDFDLDLPVDCDDEYWEHPDPKKRFKQPPNKPSFITAFILLVKLHRILSFCVRAIYSLSKVSTRLGLVGDQWKSHIVAELDSSLNSWLESIPDNLRWDPKRENNKFFNQSAILYAMCHYTQILVHRPFIPSPSKPSSLPFPSLAICTNAARACINIAYTQIQRNTHPPPPVQISAFTSAVVLMFGIWGGKTSGSSSEHEADMENVQKVLQVLKSAEDRWHQAGRLWDILSALSSKGENPLRRQEGGSESGFEGFLVHGSEEPSGANLSLPHSPTLLYKMFDENSAPSQPSGHATVRLPVVQDLPLGASTPEDYWNFALHDYHLNHDYLPREPVGDIGPYIPDGTGSKTQALPEMNATLLASQQAMPPYFPQLAPLPFQRLSTTLNAYHPTQNRDTYPGQVQEPASALVNNQHATEPHSEDIIHQRLMNLYSNGDSLASMTRFY